MALYINACTFINARGTTYLPSRLRKLKIKQNLSNLLIFSHHIGISIRYLLKRTLLHETKMLRHFQIVCIFII